MNSYSTEEKRQCISELKKEAENVKEIIGIYKKRRPVVIEFSGAPKSGKTSSINSLMQFLKRNDFKVKVLPESASICPVKDKHSPMFNLWTACDSIKSLVGVLESDRTAYDVIIVDRGIFDAMCWFQWLWSCGKMESSMKQIMDQFLSMEELVSYIDIVFVYKARPEVSIEREYASLLTDIRGSIMNEEILGAYLQAIEATVASASQTKLFRKIQVIDTSDKNQNIVGREVTMTALESLRELFEERVGYITIPEELGRQLQEEPFMEYGQLEKHMEAIGKIQFGRRSILEEDYKHVQLIPIAVFKEADSNQVFIVKKPVKATREDSREKDKILSYVGGHIRLEDKNWKNGDSFLEICKTALKREVKEELDIAISLDNLKPDIIYVKDGSRSDIHMAVCFFITERKSTMSVRVNGDELLLNRGKGKSGTFVEPESIANDGNSWTRIILEKYFYITPDLEQLSLF